MYQLVIKGYFCLESGETKDILKKKEDILMDIPWNKTRMSDILALQWVFGLAPHAKCVSQIIYLGPLPNGRICSNILEYFLSIKDCPEEMNKSLISWHKSNFLESHRTYLFCNGYLNVSFQGARWQIPETPSLLEDELQHISYKANCFFCIF